MKTTGMVALVGRPNVGKSTLFNRMTRSRDAITDDRPGVTRDRVYGKVECDEGEFFSLIDTGGFETGDFNFQPFSENLVWQQTQAAIEQCSLVVLLLDAKAGLHQHDIEIARYVEKIGKKLIPVVNKVDGEEQKIFVYDFYQLLPEGVEGIACVSAAHSRGVRDLTAMIADELRAIGVQTQKLENDEEEVRLALIGKPNAGKSSILNRLLGEERSLVSEIAGTTRDSIDETLSYNGKLWTLVDTAGMRRKAKIQEKLESHSVIRSLAAIESADVVALVIDAEEGLTDQDMKLAGLALDRHKALMIVVNKWDLIPNKTSNTMRDYEQNVVHDLGTMSFVPVSFVSALENKRVHNILKNAEELVESWSTRIPTAKLNECLQEVVGNHTPQLVRAITKRVKFYYATQVKTSPPTIVIKTNMADEIQESYKRYMLNQFRRRLGMENVPLRLFFRDKSQKEQKAEARAEREKANTKAD